MSEPVKGLFPRGWLDLLVTRMQALFTAFL